MCAPGASPKNSIFVNQQAASSPPSQSSPPSKLSTCGKLSEQLKWRRGPLIGEGSFGKVYIGMDEVTGQMLAIKVIDFCSVDKKVKQRLASLQQEIKVLRALDHPCIVRYVCSQRIGTSINIFMEYVPGGSLSSLLKQFGALGETTVVMYTRELIDVLQYLHENGVVHRDVKAANVLVTVGGVLKLSDFGSAVYIQEGTKVGTAGTSFWMAPEVIANEISDFPCDIWSLGCTVLEMLTAQNPWFHISEKEMVVMQYIGELANNDIPLMLPRDLEAQISVECTDFLCRYCLIGRPEARATAAELAEHPLLFKPDEIEMSCGGESGQTFFESPVWSSRVSQCAPSPMNSLHNNNHKFNMNANNCEYSIRVTQSPAPSQLTRTESAPTLPVAGSSTSLQSDSSALGMSSQCSSYAVSMNDITTPSMRSPANRRRTSYGAPVVKMDRSCNGMMMSSPRSHHGSEHHKIVKSLYEGCIKSIESQRQMLSPSGHLPSPAACMAYQPNRFSDIRQETSVRVGKGVTKSHDISLKLHSPKGWSPETSVRSMSASLKQASGGRGTPSDSSEAPLPQMANSSSGNDTPRSGVGRYNSSSFASEEADKVLLRYCFIYDGLYL